MPLIGIFMNLNEDDREVSTRRDAFLQGLGPMGDLRIAMRFGGGDYDTYKGKADALATLNPDLYLCSCWPTLRAVLKARDPSKPVVFAGLADLTTNPAGNYSSEPNVYGFIDYGTNLVSQWPALLSQIAPAPAVQRAAVIWDVTTMRPNYKLAYNAIDTAKGNLTLKTIDVRSNSLANDIRDFQMCTGAFTPTGGACTSNTGGLIVPANTPMAVVRNTIIPAAAKYGLPAIYGNRLYAIHGGLISRGTNTTNLYVYAGHYANQILNPACWPRCTPPSPAVNISQTGYDANHPAVFETVINLKTAKALGGSIWTNAQTMAQQADLVIAPE